MYWLIEHIKAEWETVMKMPVISLVILVAGIGVGWTAARAFDARDLQIMRDQVAGSQPKPERNETSPTPTPSPASAANAQGPFTGTLLTPTDILGKSELGQQTPLYALVDKMGWPKPLATRKLKEVWDGHYIGIPIPLDGYIYYNATFENVTFEYDGKLPSGGWVNSQLKGTTSFITGSPAIKTAAIFFQSLNINPAACVGESVPPSLGK